MYPEAFLQNIAYRHAAALDDMPPTQGLVVRLPKLVDDPAPEPVWVPPHVHITDFLAALHLWRCLRRLEGRPIGSWRPQEAPHDRAREAAAPAHPCLAPHGVSREVVITLYPGGTIGPLREPAATPGEPFRLDAATLYTQALAKEAGRAGSSSAGAPLSP